MELERQTTSGDVSNQQAFRENGFVLFRKLISEDAIQNLFKCLQDIYLKHAKSLGIPTRTFSGWSDPKFSEALIHLRNIEPKIFGIMYDSMQTSGALLNLLSEQALYKAAGKLLNGVPHGFAATGQMVRMDPPSDTRNSLNWHQEWSYYRQNLVADNGLVVWIPLHDLTVKDGPVIVCPGSHKLGHINVPSTGKDAYEKSEQFQVPDEYVNRFTQHDAVANAGDVLMFHMNLFHRSGLNISDRIRFVAGVRFHNMLTNDYIPGRNIYKENETALKMYQSKTSDS